MGVWIYKNWFGRNQNLTHFSLKGSGGRGDGDRNAESDISSCLPFSVPILQAAAENTTAGKKSKPTESSEQPGSKRQKQEEPGETHYTGNQYLGCS